jgi:serine/threonine protein kinase
LRAKSIVHRDLKPGNFLFSETWHLVLADFGTAKELKEEEINTEKEGI